MDRRRASTLLSTRLFNPLVKAATNEWRTLAPMHKPRGGIGAATVRGRIVVAGGEEPAGTIREVELYEPRRAAGRGSATSRRLATDSASSPAAAASM